MAEPLHATCVETTNVRTHNERTWVCGADCPRPVTVAGKIVCSHGFLTQTIDGERVHLGTHGLCSDANRGPVTPVEPDAERDRRREIYAERARAAARRALDAWFQAVILSVVPNSALSAEKWHLLMESCNAYRLSSLPHSGHYGVPPERIYGWAPTANGVEPLIHQNPDSVPPRMAMDGPDE